MYQSHISPLESFETSPPPLLQKKVYILPQHLGKTSALPVHCCSVLNGIVYSLLARDAHFSFLDICSTI